MQTTWVACPPQAARVLSFLPSAVVLPRTPLVLLTWRKSTVLPQLLCAVPPNCSAGLRLPSGSPPVRSTASNRPAAEHVELRKTASCSCVGSRHSGTFRSMSLTHPFSPAVSSLEIRRGPDKVSQNSVDFASFFLGFWRLGVGGLTALKLPESMFPFVTRLHPCPHVVTAAGLLTALPCV